MTTSRRRANTLPPICPAQLPYIRTFEAEQQRRRREDLDALIPCPTLTRILRGEAISRLFR